jgi:AcrR family transcriptional regulator
MDGTSKPLCRLSRASRGVTIAVMGRRPQPEIKAELLDQCTNYALERGLPDGLESLAEATGASARMLLYHFGSRDELLRAILVQARSRQVTMYGDLLRARPGAPYTAVLAQAWTAMTGPNGQPYLRMFGSQLRQSSEQRLWPGFRRIATTDWLGPLEDGLRSIGRPELATLVLAVIRGLLMDLEATADTARVNRAFQEFLAVVDLSVATAESSGAKFHS